MKMLVEVEILVEVESTLQALLMLADSLSLQNKTLFMLFQLLTNLSVATADDAAAAIGAAATGAAATGAADTVDA